MPVFRTFRACLFQRVKLIYRVEPRRLDPCAHIQRPFTAGKPVHLIYDCAGAAVAVMHRTFYVTTVVTEYCKINAPCVDRYRVDPLRHSLSHCCANLTEQSVDIPVQRAVHGDRLIWKAVYFVHSEAFTVERDYDCACRGRAEIENKNLCHKNPPVRKKAPHMTELFIKFSVNYFLFLATMNVPAARAATPATTATSSIPVSGEPLAEVVAA